MHVYSKSVASIESTDDDKFGPNGGFTAVLSTPSLDRDGDRLHQDEWQELPQWLPLDVDHGMSMADTVGKFHPYWDGDRMLMDAYFASTPRAQETRTLLNDLKDPDSNAWPIGVSVAFMTDKSKKDGEQRRELLNAGIVAIPSNRDAVILASKAASALKDAFSEATEGEVPEEVKQAVLETLGVKTTDLDTNSQELKTGIFVDVIPRLDEDALKRVLEEIFTKAGATASGVGGDGALVQAIHDASSHLGAACPVIEVSDEGTGASSGANKGAEPDQIDTDEHTLETFEKALDEVLAEDSPAEAAAASDEEPAPADDAADTKAKRMRGIGSYRMQLTAHINQP